MSEISLMWQSSALTNAELTSAMRNEGIDLRQGMGFEPVTTVAVIVSIAAIVRVFQSLYKDLKYCGVIIDATKKKLEIQEMPNWPSNQVLLITKKKAELLTLKTPFSDPNEIAKLVETLSELGQ